MRDDFAVFILAHGRPEKMKTVNTLLTGGYTGKYFIILDDMDDTIDTYKSMFGEDHVLVFDKKKTLETFDIMDNWVDWKEIVFARNVCFDFARELKLNYFAEFEDDYCQFAYRHPEGKSLYHINVAPELEEVFNLTLDFLESGNIRTVAFAQSGEMMGGTNGKVWKDKLKRKAMNTFFFKVGEPEDDIKFIGRFNDDVNTYVSLGSRGELFLQFANVNLDQVLTQKQTGGNTEAYKKFGTYVKSFYSVMVLPSAVRVSTMGENNKRVHHTIDWKVAVPCILSERYKLC